MNEWMMMRQKGSLNSLTLCTLKVQDGKIFAILTFLILLKKCGKKSDSSLKIGNKITKDFHVKKKIPRDFFVKWTHIKIKGNSFVKFSAGGPRSNYKGIPL